MLAITMEPLIASIQSEEIWRLGRDHVSNTLSVYHPAASASPRLGLRIAPRAPLQLETTLYTEPAYLLLTTKVWCYTANFSRHGSPKTSTFDLRGLARLNGRLSHGDPFEWPFTVNESTPKQIEFTADGGGLHARAKNRRATARSHRACARYDASPYRNSRAIGAGGSVLGSTGLC